MRLVVTYDISDDSDRRRVHNTLKRYGAWRQFSVFEVDVSKTERVELEDDLAEYVDAEDGDRIRVYRVCESCLGATTDLGQEPPDETSNVL